MSKVNPTQFLLNLAEPCSTTEPGPRVVVIKANASVKSMVGDCLELLDAACKKPHNDTDWDNMCDALHTLEQSARTHHYSHLATAAHCTWIFYGLVRGPGAISTGHWAQLEELQMSLTSVLLSIYITGSDQAAARDVSQMVRTVCNFSHVGRLLLEQPKQLMIEA